MIGDQVVGPNSSEIWVTIDPVGRLRRHRWHASSAVVDGYPGLAHKVTDLLRTSGSTSPAPGRATTLVARVYGEDLGVLRAKAAEVREAVAGIDGVESAAVELRRRSRPSRSRSTWPRPRSTGSSRATSAAPRPPAVRPRGRQPVRGPEGLRRGRLGHARDPPQPDERRGPADRHADRRPGPPGRRGRRRGRADARVIQHEDVSRCVDVAAHVSGRDVGDVARDVRAATRARSRSRSSTTPRCSAATRPSSDAQRRTCGASASRPRSGSSCCCRPPSPAGAARIVAFVALPVALAGGGSSRLASTAARSRWPPSPACSPCSGSPCATACVLIDRTSTLAAAKTTELGAELRRCVARGAVRRRSSHGRSTTVASVLPLIVLRRHRRAKRSAPDGAGRPGRRAASARRSATCSCSRRSTCGSGPPSEPPELDLDRGPSRPRAARLGAAPETSARR